MVSLGRRCWIPRAGVEPEACRGGPCSPVRCCGLPPLPSWPDWCRAATGVRLARLRLSQGQNGDFGAFLTAAASIAKGGNPYPAGGAYVYFAPLALILSLFTHVDRIMMLKGWTVAEMAAFVAAAGFMVYALRNRLSAWWEAPALFAFCAVTGPHLWAMVIELFFSVVFHAKSQFNLSYSVIGIPRILFSYTGLARPVLVSDDVRYLVTALLGLWVLGMLAVCLQRPGDRMLVVFNVMLFAVLIDPVSHLEYSILALPLVWFWVGHYRVFLDRRGWSPGGLATRALVAIAVVVWYVVQQKVWPGSAGAAPAASSIQLLPLFTVNLVLFTASVLGGRTLLGRAEPTADRAGPQPSVSTTQRSQPAREVAPSS